MSIPTAGDDNYSIDLEGRRGNDMHQQRRG